MSVYRPVVAGSHHFDEEQDPDPHCNEKLDPDPNYSNKLDPDSDPYQIDGDLELLLFLAATELILVSSLKSDLPGKNLHLGQRHKPRISSGKLQAEGYSVLL